jgi:hypothetical protein
MHEGRTVFAQLMDSIPAYEFSKCVDRYRGDYHVRSMSCYEQFLIMAFAQLTFRESLRDIETCLRTMGSKLYHCGIRSRMARSTLADANERRDWRIFADFAQVLIDQAIELHAEEDLGMDLQTAAYAVDSTIIELCLSLFPWAKFRRYDAGVKLNTLLTLRGYFPCVVVITPSRIHDVNFLDHIAFEPGAFYVMDRGYLDFARLFRIHQSSAFFVTRPRHNARFRRRYSHPVDKAQGIRFDQTVLLNTFYPRKGYPAPLRRIGYYDAPTEKRLIFVTNNFVEPALTIASLYRCRWQIELFFKWIKQHLRIQAFYGTSENAVKTQIWIAIAVYVLIAIIRKRLHLPHSLYTLLQILSISLFEKTPILQVLAQRPPLPEPPAMQHHQCLPGFLTGQ